MVVQQPITEIFSLVVTDVRSHFCVASATALALSYLLRPVFEKKVAQAPSAGSRVGCEAHVVRVTERHESEDGPVAFSLYASVLSGGGIPAARS